MQKAEKKLKEEGWLAEQMASLQKRKEKGITTQIPIATHTRTADAKGEAVKAMNSLVTMWKSVQDSMQQVLDKLLQQEQDLDKEIIHLRVQISEQQPSEQAPFKHLPAVFLVLSQAEQQEFKQQQRQRYEQQQKENERILEDRRHRYSNRYLSFGSCSDLLRHHSFRDASSRKSTLNSDHRPRVVERASSFVHRRHTQVERALSSSPAMNTPSSARPPAAKTTTKSASNASNSSKDDSYIDTYILDMQDETEKERQGLLKPYRMCHPLHNLCNDETTFLVLTAAQTFLESCCVKYNSITMLHKIGEGAFAEVFLGSIGEGKR
jgi:hypothetical protein